MGVAFDISFGTDSERVGNMLLLLLFRTGISSAPRRRRCGVEEGEGVVKRRSAGV